MRFRTVLLLAMLGCIIGVVSVPRAVFDEFIWSKVVRSLAQQNVYLECRNPRFNLRGLTTERCNARIQALGVEFERVSAHVIGLFPPRVKFEVAAFGERCEAVVTAASASITAFSVASVSISSCALQIATVPQLAGFGFSGGTLNITAQIQPRAPATVKKSGPQRDKLPLIRAELSATGVKHPQLTTSRLGFGQHAPVIIIPAFVDGALRAQVTLNDEQRTIELPEVTTTLFKMVEGRISEAPTNNNATPTISGKAKLTLTPEGIRQYGAMLDALSLSNLPNTEALGAGPSGAVNGGAQYTVQIQGTRTKPSFRVLKSSQTR